MTLVCFASQKGSPGTTVTALAVAAAWRPGEGRRKLLLEADCTGGTLAIRYQLPVQPGLATLAAAARSGLDEAGLWAHTQVLPGGLSVVVCPDGPDQVSAAMAAGGPGLARFLRQSAEVDVICDVGRLAPDSPAVPFVAEANAVLMVARPSAEQLQPAARRLLSLKPVVANLGWVLVGDKPYGPVDVEATYGHPVVGVIAEDARSVADIERGVVGKGLRRRPFIRSATTLANTLVGWMAVPPAADEPTPDRKAAAPSNVSPAPVDYLAPEVSSAPLVEHRDERTPWPADSRLDGSTESDGPRAPQPPIPPVAVDRMAR